MKYFSLLKFIAVPAFLAAVVLSLFFAREFFQFPADEELMPIIRGLYDQYGLLVIFLSALIEGIFVIGWYFPGTTIILFCLLLAGEKPLDVFAITIAAASGLSIAYVGNYAIGKYGWYKLLLTLGLKTGLERAKNKLELHGVSAIVLSYWQFTLASLVSTAAGILRFPFVRFVAASVITTFFWVCFWSTLIFLLGNAAMTLIGLPFILSVLLAWIVLALCFKLLVDK